MTDTSKVADDLQTFYFHTRDLNETGQQLGGRVRRMDAEDIAKAKKLIAKTYPSEHVFAVSVPIWLAPEIALGPKREGQFAKELRARKLSYGKLK